jgi:hypothetical protein
MRPLLSLLFAALILWSGCTKEKAPETKNFTLTFRATYDGQPLEKYKNYPYGNRSVQINKFSTYLSDLVLLRSDGSEQRLFDIEWVDFTPDLASDNRSVAVTFQYNVPDGDYAALKIGYGVRPDLNAKRPSDFPANHPLIQENEYWLGWKSYIFTKVQGFYDLDGDANPEASITYHCGGDATYTTAQMSKSLKVDGTGQLEIVFDVKKLFGTGSAQLDLNQSGNRNTSHSMADTQLGEIIMANFANATSL